MLGLTFKGIAECLLDIGLVLLQCDITIKYFILEESQYPKMAEVVVSKGFHLEFE